MCATILYISYTGVMEPLGHSQVYQYLKSLSEDHEILLITYEKPDDLNENPRVAETTERLASDGIDWYPFKYHKSPPIPATLWDIFRGILLGLYLVKRHNVEILHARSYIAGSIAMVLDAISQTKFIFDMRGFWVDERVDAGIWSTESWIYSLMKKNEQCLLEQADVVVSLTEVGIDVIKGLSHVDTSDTEFRMIPTCVNLELFTPEKCDKNGKFTICYLGSVGTWYLFDEVLECFSILRESKADSVLKIINRGDHDYVRERLDAHDIPERAVSIQALDHRNVPSALSTVDAGILFYKPTFSRKGTSPTRLGEFLAAGVPCLTNYGIGDISELLEENRVGVVLKGFDEKEKRRAVEALNRLAEADGIEGRCRRLAEQYYALETGVRKYDELYRQLASRPP